MPKPIVLLLGSCTVFAEELSQIQTEAQLQEAEDWLAQHLAHNTYRVYSKGVWFLHGRDAMLFKLTWG